MNKDRHGESIVSMLVIQRDKTTFVKKNSFSKVINKVIQHFNFSYKKNGTFAERILNNRMCTCNLNQMLLLVTMRFLN